MPASSAALLGAAPGCVDDGFGAFVKSREQAAGLARTVVDIGRSHGVATTAVLTDMATPLERTAGNAV